MVNCGNSLTENSNFIYKDEDISNSNQTSNFSNKLTKVGCVSNYIAQNVYIRLQNLFNILSISHLNY